MLRMAALLALFVLQASILPGQKGPPAPLYPPGTTDIELEGLAVTLRVPEGLTRKEPGSLVVLLHGLGGRGKRLMTLLHDWEQQNYLICAPQATGRGWNAADLEAVEKIALHLLKNMPMDPDRVHVMVDGRIVLSGGYELSLKLEEEGYEGIIRSLQVS